MKKRVIYAWSICLLGALFYAYDFLLRVMPSVMIHPLMNAFDASATQIGFLSAFYYYAYTPLQLPAGLVVDKYSPRHVLSLSALFCALGTLLFATTNTLIFAYLSRAMMGIGSAFAFVGALKLASIWLPENRFALFAGLTTAFGTIGAVFADNLLSFLVNDFGWQYSAYASGLVGLIITLLIFLMIRDKKPSQETKNLSWKVTFLKMLHFSKNKYVWINGIIGALSFMPISVFAALWGTEFFAKAYDVSASHAASAISLIFIGMAVGAPFVGQLSERLKSRKIPMLMGNTFTILSLITLLYVKGLPLVFGYILLFAIGFFTAPQILVFAIANDLTKDTITGITTSVTNFIVTLGAALFQPLIGFMLDCLWSGQITTLGTANYSLANFQIALSFLILALILSIIMIGFLPKTKTPSHP